MPKLKRLSNEDDNIVHVKLPVTMEEVKDRNEQYQILTPMRFAKRYMHHLFESTSFQWNGNEYEVQYNFCINPYCKWFGLPQKKFENVKYKPSRYKITGRYEDRRQNLHCNPDPENPNMGITLGCSCQTISNWSVVEEIRRLITIETIKGVEPDYNFHKNICPYPNSTPFNNEELFRKKGTSKAKSQRYQCKVCEKFTNVLPMRKQSTTYHKKRNDILLDLVKALVNKVPIKRTTELLGIGVKTYYEKLELAYKRCLEFLERHEQRGFETIEFEEFWINTDKMIYSLSNVRKKGFGRKSPAERNEESKFPTNIVISSEMKSRYVLRADIAYDWNFTLNDLALDTILYKDDHLHEFSKKNSRFRKGFTSYPMEPTKNDTQSYGDFQDELTKFDIRQKYVDGIHVNATYTSIAHFWLIKQRIKAKEWRIVTDEDNSLLSAAQRVFANEIKQYDAHIFISKVDDEKSLNKAIEEYNEARGILLDWAQMNLINSKNLREIAIAYLSNKLKHHKFYEVLPVNKNIKHANNPINHPLASKDTGYHTVDIRTDVSSYEPEELSQMLLDVNHNATDTFMQTIRRRLSSLERPLVTARGDGKSYIYANFNPEYAQYALTILRVYFNFCLPYKTKDGKNLTPAQRLGITDKVFELKDIIYMQ